MSAGISDLSFRTAAVEARRQLAASNRTLALRQSFSGFEAIIAQRGEKLDTLHQEYIACKNSLMERVGEYEYEL